MAKMQAVVYTQYRIVFFPVATYKRVGNVELLSILGLKVYKRVGDVRRLFGLSLAAKLPENPSSDKDFGLPEVSSGIPMPRVKKPKTQAEKDAEYDYECRRVCKCPRSYGNHNAS